MSFNNNWTRATGCLCFYRTFPKPQTCRERCSEQYDFINARFTKSALNYCECVPFDKYREAIIQRPEYKCGNAVLDTVEELHSEGPLHYDSSTNTCSRVNRVIKYFVDNDERPPYIVSVSEPEDSKEELGLDACCSAGA